MDGLTAAGLSQLTSLNVASKSGILLSLVGQGAAAWVPRMELLQKLCGVTRMGGWWRCWEGVRTFVTHCAVLFGFQGTELELRECVTSWKALLLLACPSLPVLTLRVSLGFCSCMVD